MARNLSTFRQSDLTRAVKGVMAAGLTPRRAEVDRDGKIIVVFVGDEAAPATDFDTWKARRDAKA